jgi:hypothetical protein
VTTHAITRIPLPAPKNTRTPRPPRGIVGQCHRCKQWVPMGSGWVLVNWLGSSALQCNPLRQCQPRSLSA